MADEMFRPPINRAMKVLDRSFFKKKVSVSAARVLDVKSISKCRLELQRHKDVLSVPRISIIHPDPQDPSSGRKCILLRPELKDDGAPWPWSSKVTELKSENLIDVVPYDIEMDYDDWDYYDIANAILPNADHDEEIPSGFAIVGHVAHLNLRDRNLEYKDIIGQVLLDKNPGVRLVINKIDDVGEENEYRTFKYEVLAGEHDMNVEVHESDCTFRFNYAKVYWNTRLNTEHGRMIELFKPGEAICDVMAGIGPFAVPAGKRKVFAWANDLNPDSYTSLVDAVTRNKVSDFVSAHNENGHTFIRSATSALLHGPRRTARVYEKRSRTAAKANPKAPPKVLETLHEPKFFSHYVMNLPASALTFLPDFIGLYSSPQDKALMPPDAPMPMIHAYCFSTKSDDNVAEGIKICKEISELIGYEITPQTPETTIWDVRDVAPQKRMFCASFRLPKEVAFRRASADASGI